MAKRKVMLSFIAASILTSLTSCQPISKGSSSVINSQENSVVESSVNESSVGSGNNSSQKVSSSETKVSSSSSTSNKVNNSSSSGQVSPSSSQGGVVSSSQNGTNNSTSSSSNDGFSITTDLSKALEIHTAQQKTYLSYSGDYSKMPENMYPDGNQHISEPNPVSLAWNHTPKAGKTIRNYSVTFGKEANLSDGYEVVGNTTKSASLYNVFLGTNYFKINANYTDNTVESSEIKTFNVDSSCPRNLKIEGMTNCRDVGGRNLIDGGYIKQGLLYRTSATNGWGNNKAVIPDNITSSGKKELLEHLKVKTEINVNGSGSNQVGVKNFVGAYMDYGGGKHHFYRNAESVKKVFATLANENNYPVFYHCRIGTDRTGLVSILVSGLLGVEKNEIYQDYLFSNFGNIQEKRYLGDRAGEDNILNYMADIEAMPGEKFQNKVYNILLSIGVPREHLDSVINILTVGNKASGNEKGQLPGFDNLLVGSGVNATAKNDNGRLPMNFALNSTSKSVSRRFNVASSYKAMIVGYLGNTESTTSKYVDNAISVTVDNNKVTVPHITYKEAGFGNCSGRMNYAPVILGNIDVASGEHTVKITGTSNSINVAGITILNNGPVTSTPVIGGESSNDQPPVDVINPIVLSISSAKEGMKSPTTKHDKTGTNSYTIWDISSIKAGTYILSISAKMTSDHSSRYWYNMKKRGNESATSNPDQESEADYRYEFSVDAVKYNITNEKTYGENGMSTSSYTDVEMCQIVIPSGARELKIARCNIGYSVYIEGISLMPVNA